MLTAKGRFVLVTTLTLATMVFSILSLAHAAKDLRPNIQHFIENQR